MAARLTFAVPVALLAAIGTSSCSDKSPSPAGPTEPPKLQAAAATGGGAGGPVQIQGAGASFPAPLYLRWFKGYSGAHPGVQVDYQSVGSGSGVKSFIDKTVDFGASDAAMTPEELSRVDGGAQLMPMTAGEIVLAYDLPGVNELKLSRKAYVGIFLGQVKRWNDPLIAKSNPGAKLPDSPINVVVRADSSGTTFVFTKHLSALSEEFAKSPGNDKMPAWPVGTRSKGNEGVTASLKTTPGSIGYVEYAYAKSQSLPMALLENRSGAYVAATTASGQAALAGAQLPESLIAWAPDPEGADAYPIVTYTWIMLYRKYPDRRKLEAIKDLFSWTLTTGQAAAEPLGYIPLPQNVVERCKAALQTVEAGGAVTTR
jgi:phosphate transport system substrate-binding protein